MDDFLLKHYKSKLEERPKGSFASRDALEQKYKVRRASALVDTGMPLIADNRRSGRRSEAGFNPLIEI